MHGGGSTLERIRWWWGQPDHYVWFSSYLHARGLATMARAVLAVTSASFALIFFAMLWSSAPPDGAVRVVLSILSVVSGTGCALLWVLRWPTKSESIAFAAAASVSIATATLAQSDPTIALVACTAFVAVSGYIAVFHTAVCMVANVVLVVVVPAVPAVALVTTHGVIRAASEYGLVLVVNIAVPFGLQILVHALGADLLNADRDPLTGLLNRRAFYERVGELVAIHGLSESHLVVAMIDLDRFKQLNDTEGHAAGDRVLKAVGHVLREHTRPSAVVGRVGGEEFLVADVFADPRQAALGQRLCDAVAALPHAITASIGIASARCDQFVERHDPNLVITALIASADSAMYDAKRNGGNRSRQRVGPLDQCFR
ncbi:MAG: diguanylate cyclase [Mycobacterium sp.]|nr:diguanylate cyclase [Mycobacterium sp.]